MDKLANPSELIPTVRRDGESLILWLRGELDLHNSAELRTEVFDLLGRGKTTRLVLNMTGVPYMDSSALAVLVEALKKLLKTGGRVFLFGLQPRVKGLIEIARLGTIFQICQTEAEALTR